MDKLTIQSTDSGQAGVFPAFREATGVHAVRLVSSSGEAVYELVESTGEKSLEQTILGCGVTSSFTNEPSVFEWTAMYSGERGCLAICLPSTCSCAGSIGQAIMTTRCWLSRTRRDKADGATVGEVTIKGARRGACSTTTIVRTEDGPATRDGQAARAVTVGPSSFL